MEKVIDSIGKWVLFNWIKLLGAQKNMSSKLVAQLTGIGLPIYVRSREQCFRIGLQGFQQTSIAKEGCDNNPLWVACLEAPEVVAVNKDSGSEVQVNLVHLVRPSTVCLKREEEGICEF